MRISETLLRFVEPILRHVPDEAGVKATRSVVSLGVSVWNAEILDRAAGARGSFIDELRKQAALTPEPERTQVLQFLDELIERKRTHFASDRRLIGEFDVFDDGGGNWRIRAEARMPPGGL